MKQILLTMMALAIVAGSFAQKIASNFRPMNKLNEEHAAFNWSGTQYDFGKIKVGVPVTYEFSFTNTGKVPLVISSVQASCGCTVTSYSKEPIQPAGKGFVKATYNAAKVGQFTKTVSVNANTEEGIVQLTIKGEVVE